MNLSLEMEIDYQMKILPKTTPIEGCPIRFAKDSRIFHESNVQHELADAKNEHLFHIFLKWRLNASMRSALTTA